ncbi:MAG: DUF1552 domain-containing protein [Myxococcota bacterium]
MRYRHVLDRRTFLRGTGSVAIALPFLDAMRTTSVYAASPEPPERCVTVFFGLGVPRPAQDAGYVRGLAPLAPFAGKLLMTRGLDFASPKFHPHYDGAGFALVGSTPKSENRAGGASIDQRLKGALPEGRYSPRIDTLAAGTFFRRNRENRYLKCWNRDGNVVTRPIEDPQELFRRLFGDVVTPPEDDPAEAKRARYRRSVLDSVVEQYNYMMSDAAGLGTRSKQKVSEHLERIRELETRIFPSEEQPPITTSACNDVVDPGSVNVLEGQTADGGGGSGPDLRVDRLQARMRDITELYAFALRCDTTRFGNLLLTSAGERFTLNGAYQYNGQDIEFDDKNDSVGKGAAHEYWHGWKKNDRNEEWMHRHLHFVMSEVVHFFTLLDDPEFADENGQTIFENMLLVMTTELGDHSGHGVKDVFHAVSGANGRIKTGEIMDLDDRRAAELYRACLSSYGIDESGSKLDAVIAETRAI